MSQGELSPLQERILHLLADLEPRFTLTGGAALIGFYLHHRTTRDVDLFWRRREALRDLVPLVRDRLREAELEVVDVQTATTFHRLRVATSDETTIVDLVAEPTAPLEEPVLEPVGDRELQVDTAHEILVSKLCTLLGRTELRDLEDIGALLDAGGDLERAVRDAPHKDGGFSPLVLAWLLDQFPLEPAARALDWESERIETLEATRARLIERLTELPASEED